MKTIVGVDPGKSGAVAIMWEDVGRWDMDVYSMPETEREVFDLMDELIVDDDFEVYIEEVGGFAGKGQPGSAMFTFGRGFGFLLGCLSALKVRYTLVRPQKWQKHFGLGTKGTRTTTQWKNHLWQRACELYPQTKILKSQGDAVLIAEYGRVQR